MSHCPDCQESHLENVCDQCKEKDKEIAYLKEQNKELLKLAKFATRFDFMNPRTSNWAAHNELVEMAKAVITKVKQNEVA